MSANAQGTGSVDPNLIFNPAGREITDGQPDFYTYTAEFLAVAPNATPSQIIQVDASAQFLLTAIAYQANAIPATSTYTESTNPIPLVRVLITDSGSAKQLMNNPVYLSNLGGVRGWPHRLIHPRFFDKSSAIQIQMTSDDGTTWGRIQIALIGFRIYG